MTVVVDGGSSIHPCIHPCTLPACCQPAVLLNKDGKLKIEPSRGWDEPRAGRSECVCIRRGETAESGLIHIPPAHPWSRCQWGEAEQLGSGTRRGRSRMGGGGVKR